MHLQEKFGVNWSIEKQQFILEVNGKLISTYQFLDPNHSKCYSSFVTFMFKQSVPITDLYLSLLDNGDESVKTLSGRIVINGDKYIIGNR